ncbi:hypothetical protein E3O44_06830 [Cryobacterium algoricola]|uniref:Resolvase/invertase-type recombinase catalytic domain-containing protein n=1 Tax=Cryobacterium algoricola TaxID=1259183 RepID=A0ABY2IEF2_9MICO|nr:hypothetical protein E3O44_06830 [Cryobacterium algoricola]
MKEQLSFTGEDNAMANLLPNVRCAFAEFEHSLIRERQREGITPAKTRGASCTAQAGWLSGCDDSL